jgi:hypothetical protein
MGFRSVGRAMGGRFETGHGGAGAVAFMCAATIDSGARIILYER